MFAPSWIMGQLSGQGRPNPTPCASIGFSTKSSFGLIITATPPVSHSVILLYLDILGSQFFHPEEFSTISSFSKDSSPAKSTQQSSWGNAPYMCHPDRRAQPLSLPRAAPASVRSNQNYSVAWTGKPTWCWQRWNVISLVSLLACISVWPSNMSATYLLHPATCRRWRCSRRVLLFQILIFNVMFTYIFVLFYCIIDSSSPIIIALCHILLYVILLFSYSYICVFSYLLYLLSDAHCTLVFHPYRLRL